MPAMSPTMTQGNIGKWQVKEGDSFVAGDVLVTIETDKAEIDVEAQDDGILGRILKGDGTNEVKVGDNIAFLSEEGDTKDDIEAAASSSASSASSSSSSSKPAETSKKSEEPSRPTKETSSPPAPSQPTTTATHDLPKSYAGLLPSVLSLCLSHNIEDPTKIKPTGLKGLTKGDVLAHLGLTKRPLGSLDEAIAKGWTTLADFGAVKATNGDGKPSEAGTVEPATAAEIRRAILEGLARPLGKPTHDLFAAPTFDSVLRDYASQRSTLPPTTPVSSAAMAARSLPRGDSLRAVLEA